MSQYCNFDEEELALCNFFATQGVQSGLTKSEVNGDGRADEVFVKIVESLSLKSIQVSPTLFPWYCPLLKLGTCFPRHPV